MSRRLKYNPPSVRPLRVVRLTAPDLMKRYSAGGGYISPATRRLVWRRDSGACCRCGSKQELHFDHVVPRSLGGGGDATNVELLCKRCNLAKGASVAVSVD
jgi:5-methylcytosine-specific restriction endonuclease McrA